MIQCDNYYDGMTCRDNWSSSARWCRACKAMLLAEENKMTDGDNHSLKQHLYYLGSGHHVVLKRELPIFSHIHWQIGMAVQIEECDDLEIEEINVELKTGLITALAKDAIYFGEFNEEERQVLGNDGWLVTEWPKMSERVIAAKRSQLMQRS